MPKLITKAELDLQLLHDICASADYAVAVEELAEVNCNDLDPGTQRRHIISLFRATKNIALILERAIESQSTTHSVQLCRDSTDYGEGCPIENCKCTCHEARTSIAMSRVAFPR